jgi:hypothetical protein
VTGFIVDLGARMWLLLLLDAAERSGALRQYPSNGFTGSFT